MWPAELLTSPWSEAFDEFARTIVRKAYFVSPFIGREPLERLVSAIRGERTPHVDILTNLSVDNLVQGSTDARAIARFCRDMVNVRVRHLPGLHAKVYIADNRLAIITSSNLTAAGLSRNYEYGIRLTESAVVNQIVQDLEAYGALGSEMQLVDLEQIAETSESLLKHQRNILESARSSLRHSFERQIEAAREVMRQLRARPGESTSSIFARTILHLLRNGPLSTMQLHPLIQHIHPDLCDDSIDRVINGVHFGKRWKHMVRSAQQHLKSLGQIRFAGGLWYLV